MTTPPIPRAPGTTASTLCSNRCATISPSSSPASARPATNVELRELWSTFMQKWVDRTAAVITAERARGAAPDTVPAQDLAAALNLMNERTMFASYTGQKPAIAEDAALDALVHIWITSIYGKTPH